MEPIVVQFPARVHLDAAVVGALGSGAAATPCSPLRQPWTGRENELPRIGAMQVGSVGRVTISLPYDAKDLQARWDRFRELALAAPVLSAGLPAALERARCAQPNLIATTVFVRGPDLPQDAIGRAAAGVVHVVVPLDARSAIGDAHLLRSSGDRVLDAAALDVVRHSEFRTATFRCRPVAGTYLFTVAFVT
jgi:TonB family protein